MKRIGIALTIGLLVSAPQCTAAQDATPAARHEAGAAVIRIEDVHRFYAIYDAADGRPSAEVFQRHYLDRGSEGLRQLARARNVTDARLSPVTIAVGRGRPVAVGSPVTGIQIGLEALCATDWLNPDLEDRFVHVIAHEYAHVQQRPELADNEHPTVLEGSLMEGAAELVGELISGKVAYSHLAAMTKGREKEIETAFTADQDKTDLSDWLFNTAAGKPGDLGYWAGYRIVKAHYRQAVDKRRALREILEMSDPKAFLETSGWYPGIELD